MYLTLYGLLDLKQRKIIEALETKTFRQYAEGMTWGAVRGVPVMLDPGMAANNSSYW